LNIVLGAILIYVLLQLVLGYVISRGIHTEDDYLLAGRRLGYGLATFSIFATWFGAEACIGTSGAAFSEGLYGVTADPFGYGLCLLLMGMVFAVPLWKRKLTTIADLLRLRYSFATERLTAFIIAPASLLWAAAQIRAFGQILSASSDLTVTAAITVAACVVVAYTVMGGLLADAISDLIQGAILIIGLILLVPFVLNDGGGLANAFASISPERLSMIPPGTDRSVMSILRVIETWAIPICGSVLAQEIIAKVLASRSALVARRSALSAGVLYICVGLIPLSIGLIGVRLFPELDHPEHILPVMAQTYFSTFFYIIFAGALVSAILSTVDSALLAASALVSRNIISSIYPGMNDRQRLFTNRVGVFVMGCVAYVLALHAEGVYNLVLDASSFGSAGLFVAAIFGLFTRFGGARSAIAALCTGAVIWIVGNYIIDLELSYLIALAGSFGAYALVAFGEKLFGSGKTGKIPQQHS
jgi:Na+/proline symporter